MNQIIMNGYQVGDIIVSQWGYDQTNTDFYRILKRTAKTVWLEPLKVTREFKAGHIYGHVMPVIDEPKDIGHFELGSSGSKWDNKPIRKMIKYNDQGEAIGFSMGHGWAKAWDGKPTYFSEGR